MKYTCLISPYYLQHGTLVGTPSPLQHPRLRTGKCVSSSTSVSYSAPDICLHTLTWTSPCAVLPNFSPTSSLPVAPSVLCRVYTTATTALSAGAAGPTSCVATTFACGDSLPPPNTSSVSPRQPHW